MKLVPGPSRIANPGLDATLPLYKVSRLQKLIITPLVIILSLIGLGICLGLFLKNSTTRKEKENQTWLDSHPQSAEKVGPLFGVRQGRKDSTTSIFLVHGSPGDWSAFRRYLEDPDLTDKFQVISVDRLGYGRSNPNQTISSFQDQADALIPWAQQATGKRIWLGHSFGVPIIAKLAVSTPELVDGLILVSGAMDPDYEEKRWFHHLAEQGISRAILSRDLTRANEEAIAFHAELQTMGSDWQSIRCPTILLHAKNDQLAHPAHIPYTEDRFRRGKVPYHLNMLPDGNHFLIWNRYDIVISEIRAMAKRIRDEPPATPEEEPIHRDSP